jgi:hypothetical protein
LSRRYFGVLTSVSAGSGMARSPFLFTGSSLNRVEMLIPGGIGVNPADLLSPSARKAVTLPLAGG